MDKFLEMFLTINPEPSDAQMHALAEAIGKDKETVEALVYKMLGREINESEPDGLLEAATDTSVDQDVLDGDYDEATTSADDLATNDGAVDDDSITDTQDALRDDGAISDPVAQATQDALEDDGTLAVSITAKSRLALHKVASGE